MKLFKKTSNLFMLLIASVAIANSAMAGPCSKKKNSKPENIAKYKTPEMVKFVDSTINFLNSTQNPNQRHLSLFSKCQKTFASGKKKVKGIESQNLKLCNSLKDKVYFDIQNVAVKLPSDEIKLNDQKLPNISIKKESIAIKKEAKNTTNQFIEKDNSVSKNDTGLMLF